MLNGIALIAMILSGVIGTMKHGPLASKTDQIGLPLRLSIRVQRDAYRMSDKLTLETQLTNVGTDPIFLNEWDLCWNFARGLVLRVINAKGSDVRTNTLLDCVPPPPQAGDVYRFVKIDAGRFYGSTTEFAIRDLVNVPGEYDLGVSFESSISAKWVSEFLRGDPISKLPLWTSEKPPLKARPIHIKILP